MKNYRKILIFIFYHYFLKSPLVQNIELNIPCLTSKIIGTALGKCGNISTDFTKLKKKKKMYENFIMQYKNENIFDAFSQCLESSSVFSYSL